MTGPKHLWSGDWERESESAASQIGDHTPSTPPPEPSASAPDDPTEGSAWPRVTRRSVFTSVAVVVVAIAAVALGTTLGGSTKPKPKRVAQASAQGTNPFGFPQSLFPQTNQSQGNSGNSGSSGNSQPNTVPQTAPQTSQNTPGTATNQPTVDWLGMQIINGPNQTVVIETVSSGAGENAGLEPGDEISTINGHSITSDSQIASAVGGVGNGHHVQVQVNRGTSVYSTTITLGAAPTTQQP
jgi:membrane-associated protease RseP (regulator of RpoE activity)